jgi:hypothetical protein
MLDLVVTRVGAGGSTTIAIVRINDEDLKAKPEFINPPDARTSKLIRRALDQLDDEAAKI